MYIHLVIRSLDASSCLSFQSANVGLTRCASPILHRIYIVLMQRIEIYVDILKLKVYTLVQHVDTRRMVILFLLFCLDPLDNE
jgi:hypothetical protein